jgi:hypothetical protein
LDYEENKVLKLLLVLLLCWNFESAVLEVAYWMLLLLVVLD